MKRKVFLVILLGLVCSKVLAQHYISLEGERIKTDKLNFRITEVIDGRDYKGDIGWAQKGLLNNKVYVYFSRPFEEELQSLMNNSFQVQEKPYSLAMVVHTIKVSELTTAMSETAKAEFSLSFYLKEGEDTYYFVEKVYAAEEDNGMDVTHKHSANLVAAMEKGLQSISDSDILKALEGKELVSKSQILRQDSKDSSAEPPQAPIFLTDTYENGVHATFEEFMNNKPSHKWYEVKVGLKVYLFLEDAYGVKTKVKEGVYGFAHNDSLYVLFHRSFYPVYKKADGLYFTGPRIPDQDAVMAGAILGGAIGGVIAASTSGERKEYKIDLETGRIIEVDELLEPKENLKAKIIFYRRAKREQDKELSITMGDSAIHIIRPNQYFEMEVPVQELSICLDGKSCLSFIPLPHEVNYISCSLPKKGDSSHAIIDREDKKAGEFYIREIQRLQEK